MSAAKILKRYALITVACGLYALGFNWFFVPNRFTVGGFTGVAQIINHFLPMLPVGTVALVLNIPLFILGWRKIGRDLLISSLYATAVSSLMIDVLASLYTFPAMDPILACIYGGIVVGIGCSPPSVRGTGRRRSPGCRRWPPGLPHCRRAGAIAMGWASPNCWLRWSMRSPCWPWYSASTAR